MDVSPRERMLIHTRWYKTSIQANCNTLQQHTPTHGQIDREKLKIIVLGSIVFIQTIYLNNWFLLHASHV